MLSFYIFCCWLRGVCQRLCKIFSLYLQVTDILDENATGTMMANLTTEPNLINVYNSLIVERIIIFCVLRPVIIISGILGNLFSLIVLWRMDESTTSSKFFNGLAVADTMTLCTRGIEIVFVWGELFWPYTAWRLNSFSFFKLSLLPERISKIITVAIVFDRVVAVARPFRYKILCRPMRISIIIAICYILVAATSIPNIIRLFVFDYNTHGNRTVPPLVDEAKIWFVTHISNSTPNFLHFLFNRFVFDFAPVPLVMICNIVIIIWLRKNQIKKSAVDSNQKQLRKQQERQLTKLLLTISVLFLVLCGPLDMCAVIVFPGLLQKDTSKMDILLADSLTTLSLVNSSINFIVYTLMNKKYREEFAKLLCCFKQTDIIINDSGKNESYSKTKVTKY